MLALAVSAPPPAAAERAEADPYRGTGAWVDMYDNLALPDPERAVADMAARGVRTLYLETGSWRLRPREDIRHARLAGRYLDAAHAAGVKVVAWYLPGFADLRRDLRRVRAALRFQTPGGQRFDGFALDIEAQLVRSIPRRNRALLKLSRQIRRDVGPAYPLGAIVPDQKGTSPGGMWPGFPWRQVAGVYDAFLPMSYSTVRVRRPLDIYAYTFLGTAYIHAQTGDPATPVHVIGGIADGLTAAGADAVVRAARDAGAVGVSFYKYRLSARGEWNALAAFAPAPAAPAP